MAPVVVLLLGKKAVATHKNSENGLDALGIAAKRGHDSICSILIQHSIPSSTTDPAGRTPLMHAVRAKAAGCVAALVRHSKSSLELRDNYGMTALHYAVQQKSTNVRFLAVCSWFTTYTSRPLER